MGGDCYPGASPVKRAIERTLDRQNMASLFSAARIWREVAVGLTRIASFTGDEVGVEGSWSGNDTIWRTCLDLNRILLYGRADATLGSGPQRQVIHVVDAIVAGHGNGPLAPEPLALGLSFAGNAAPAVDWVAAHMLGYNPQRIPITKHAFDEFRWPIASFAASDVVALGDLGEGTADDVFRSMEVAGGINYPAGWRDAVEGDRYKPAEFRTQESAGRARL